MEKSGSLTQLRTAEPPTTRWDYCTTTVVIHYRLRHGIRKVLYSRKPMVTMELVITVFLRLRMEPKPGSVAPVEEVSIYTNIIQECFFLLLY